MDKTWIIPGSPSSLKAAWPGVVQANIDENTTALGVLPIIVKTSNFTIDATMIGKCINVDSPTAVVATIATNAVQIFPETGVIQIRQVGAGQVSVAGASGVTVNGFGGLKTAGQYASVYIQKQPGVSGIPTGTMLADYDAANVPGTVNNAAVSNVPDASPAGLPDLIQSTTANQPTVVIGALNGNKALNFNSTSQTLQFQGTGLDLFRNRTAMTVFIIGQYPTAQSGARTLFIHENGTATGSRATIQQRENANGKITAGTRALDGDASSFVVDPGSAMSAGENFVICAEWDYLNRRLSIYKNGTLLNQNTAWQSGVATSNTRANSGYLGSGGSSAYFGGRIARFLAFSEVSTNLRAAVHSNTQTRYNIPVSDFGGLADFWIVEGGVA